MLRKIILTATLSLSMLSMEAQKKWTLQDCMEYAAQNNISLKKSALQKQMSNEELLSSKAQLFPTLSFSSNQSVNYRPWPNAGQATVSNGYVQSGIDKVYYNGSYSLMGNWTVWNGNRNTNQVKLNQLSVEQKRMRLHHDSTQHRRADCPTLRADSLRKRECRRAESHSRSGDSE